VKLIVHREEKNPRYTQDGNREMTPVIEMAGCVVPPLHIYKGTSHTLGWHSHGTTFAVSGWTDDELRLEWLEKFTKDM